jgi:hypothetical protein
MQPSGKIAPFIGFNEDPKGCPHAPTGLAASWSPLWKVILYFPRIDAGGKVYAYISTVVRELKPFADIQEDLVLRVS